MPLVEIHKAKRRRAIKRRPEWQDTRPPEKELRAAYDIAARHEPQWYRAYMALTRELMTPAVIKNVRAALEDGDVNAAVKAIPSFKKTDPEGEKAWVKLGEKLKRAYIDVMTETGENEYRREKIPLTFRVMKDAVPVVPVNPWSLKWIEEHGAESIKEVSKQTQEVARQIVKRGFAKGQRTSAILDELKKRIGLLAKEDAAVQRRLDLMLERGTPFERATKAADRYAEQLHSRRAQRLGRTELVTAQSKGRRHAWAEAKSKGELPDVERVWVAVIASPRTCEICEELDGQPVEIGENYYSSVLGRQVKGPGADAHPQCLPGDMIVSVPEVLATTERLHDGPLVIIKTALGHRLACTPNHPILGRRRWLAAHELHVGMDVACCNPSDDLITPGVNYNHQNGPTTIHEVADSFRGACEVTSAEVPTTSEHLHGDGVYSQIAVVRTNRLLRNDIDPEVEQEIDQLQLIGALCPTHLASMGLFTELGKSANTPPGSSVGGSGLASSGINREFGPFEKLSFGAPSSLDAGLDESGLNGASVDTEGFGDSVLGLSGKVAFDKIVNVDVQSFHGPVFNLETSNGWYSAQGIVVHNCRCVELLRRKK